MTDHRDQPAGDVIMIHESIYNGPDRPGIGLSTG